MAEDFQPQGVLPPFQDRSGWMMAFGIFQIIGGMMAASYVPLLGLNIWLQRSLGAPEAAMSLGPLISAMFFYGLVAAWLVVTGIGVIRKRRWARALILVASGWNLYVGLIATIGMCFIGGSMVEQMSGQGVSAGMMEVIVIIMFLVMGAMYIGFPLVWLLFFRSPHVKATVDAWDRTRWTDACPLPVLGLAFLLVACGIMFTANAGSQFTLPFFGRILHGLPGAGITLLIFGACLGLAWGVYRRKGWAWYGSLLLVALVGVSFTLTVHLAGLGAFYEHMGLPAEQMEDMLAMMGEPGVFVILTGLNTALILGYIVFTGKSFFGAGMVEASPPVEL